MRPFLLLALFALSLSCQQDIDGRERLYGRWLLVDGSALTMRQAISKQPVYFPFSPTGTIESNWSNCYSHTFGNAGELLVRNGCIDCAAVGCNESIWQYTYTSVNELTIEFKPGDIGILRKQ
ncbi:MAG: hypothetical protein EOO88_44730 [Pedobacter sp.]|nr:MAG: hypothetical protein EOO88_44730 [Pedobacter sp.]